MRYCLRIAVLTIASAASVCAQLDCSVEMPVYDQYGKRLAFRIASVRPVAVTSEGSVDRRVIGTYRVAATGASIEFAKSWLQTDGFVANLVGPESAKIDVKVPVGRCRYRQSTVYGRNDTGADVNFSVISGRIIGCRMEGDWWVRAVPMFGGGAFVGSFEGFVNRASGEFELAASMSGQRHVVLVGRDSDVIRTISINVVVGGKNKIAPIVLTTGCK
jgi:hypothetical protein